MNGYDETAREKGPIGGACGYFANSSGTDDALDEFGADLIGGCGDTVRMQVTRSTTTTNSSPFEIPTGRLQGHCLVEVA